MSCPGSERKKIRYKILGRGQRGGPRQIYSEGRKGSEGRHGKGKEERTGEEGEDRVRERAKSSEGQMRHGEERGAGRKDTGG